MNLLPPTIMYFQIQTYIQRNSTRNSAISRNNPKKQLQPPLSQQ